MKKLLSILLVLFALEFTLAIHEFGHLKAMQKYNIEVKEFSLGIGFKLYQTRVRDFNFTVRLVPIAAYVEPTKRGNEQLKQAPRLVQLHIYVAGARNNIIAALLFSFLLQFIALTKKKISLKRIFFNILKIPVQLVILYLYCGIAVLLTLLWPIRKKIRFSISNRWGLEVFVDKPWKKKIAALALFNAIIGLLNLMPLAIIDGGKILLIFIKLSTLPLLLWSTLTLYALFSIFFCAERRNFEFVIQTIPSN